MVVNREKKPDGAGGVWSIALESQLFPWLARLASLVTPEKGAGFDPLDFNHACRVAWSTGHASGGVSASFVMLMLTARDGSEVDDGFKNI